MDIREIVEGARAALEKEGWKTFNYVQDQYLNFEVKGKLYSTTRLIIKDRPYIGNVRIYDAPNGGISGSFIICLWFAWNMPFCVTLPRYEVLDERLNFLYYIESENLNPSRDEVIKLILKLYVRQLMNKMWYGTAEVAEMLWALKHAEEYGYGGEEIDAIRKSLLATFSEVSEVNYV